MSHAYYCEMFNKLFIDQPHSIDKYIYMLQDSDSEPSFNSSFQGEIKRVQFQGNVFSNSESSHHSHSKTKRISKNTDSARIFRQRKKEQLKSLEHQQALLTQKLQKVKTNISSAMTQILNKFKAIDIHKGRFLQTKLLLSRQILKRQSSIKNEAIESKKEKSERDEQLLRLYTNKYMDELGVNGRLRTTVIERLKYEWLRLASDEDIEHKVDTTHLFSHIGHIFIDVARRVKAIDFLVRELQQIIQPQHALTLILPTELRNHKQDSIIVNQ